MDHSQKWTILSYFCDSNARSLVGILAKLQTNIALFRARAARLLGRTLRDTDLCRLRNEKTHHLRTHVSVARAQIYAGLGMNSTINTSMLYQAQETIISKTSGAHGSYNQMFCDCNLTMLRKDDVIFYMISEINFKKFYVKKLFFIVNKLKCKEIE